MQAHISRLRRQLSGSASMSANGARSLVERRADGYLLDVESDQIDVHRMRALTRRAAQCTVAVERVALLRQALDLHRGEPLAGLPGAWASRVREAWQREHLVLAVEWANAEIGLGNPVEVIARLGETAFEHPFFEPLTVVLMHSLHAAGFSAEALDMYVDIRKRMRDELGIEPGGELRRQQSEILRQTSDRLRPGMVPATVRQMAGNHSRPRRDLLA
jgi:DNA-binding SARP family transcriptional activator